MAHKVKCRWCGELNKNTQMLAIPSGTKNMYFCDESEYKKYEIQQKELNAVKEAEAELTSKFNELYIYIAVEILDYDIGQITPPNLKKRIRALNKRYDFEVIKLCVELVSKELKHYISIKEMDEKYMVNYIMVVIENNINDAYRIWKRRNEINQKPAQLQESLSVANIEYDFNVKPVKKSKSKDISAFL